MELIHYNDVGKVIEEGNSFTLWNLSKKSKTRTLNFGGFTKSIKTENIKISPTTYWSINGYDAQFEGRDANCWLCGWYGMDYGTCKCKKEGFSVEEHKENIGKARKNYLIAVLKNYFKPYVKQAKAIPYEKIDTILYRNDKGTRVLNFYFPNWSNRNESIKSMEKYLYLLENEN